VKAKRRLLDDPESWRRDPEDIPAPRFLLGNHYQRGTAGCTIGASDLETKLALVEAVGMAAGRDLLAGTPLDRPLGVLHLNAEKSQDELDRQVAAICQLHGLSQDDLGGRLFVQSVRDRPFRIVTLNGNSLKVVETIVQRLEDFILKRAIDAVQILPLVSFHAVRESDNTDMDVVIKEGLGSIAGRTQCAMEIFHQPVKSKSGATAMKVDDARGASAIVNPMHAVRVLNVMSQGEAAKFLINECERELHIKVGNGTVGDSVWFKLQPVPLPSGNKVVCAVPWRPPVTTGKKAPARSSPSLTAHVARNAPKRATRGHRSNLDA
jgi:AAA domain